MIFGKSDYKDVFNVFELMTQRKIRIQYGYIQFIENSTAYTNIYSLEKNIRGRL